MGPLVLIGDDAMVWGTWEKHDDHVDDLITLLPRLGGDYFSRWMAEHAITFLHRTDLAKFMKPNRVSGEVEYNDQSIFRVTLFITCMIASGIPIVSTGVLSTMTGLAARIGTVGAFSVLFSICLMIFTDARRAEIFALSAA
jgi:hypothetical protein